MSTEATRKIEIDAGHRLLRHEGKCKNAHGHRYAFEVTCRALSLDEVGRVVDFSVIKDRVGGWLDETWDHAFIMQVGDPLIPAFEAEGLKVSIVDYSPTAENLARHVFEVAGGLLNGSGLVVTRIRLWETPNCYVDFTGGL